MNSENSPELKRFTHSVGQNWYHIVITPKQRFPIFAQEYQRELAILAIEFVCKRHSIDLFEKEVMSDHVHLFVSCPPNYSIRRLVQLIKGGTSYYIRKNHPSLKRYKALWSKGCMYRSIGNVSAKIVKRYIKFSNQWSNTEQKKLI